MNQQDKSKTESATPPVYQPSQRAGLNLQLKLAELYVRQNCRNMAFDQNYLHLHQRELARAYIALHKEEMAQAYLASQYAFEHNLDPSYLDRFSEQLAQNYLMGHCLDLARCYVLEHKMNLTEEQMQCNQMQLASSFINEHMLDFANKYVLDHTEKFLAGAWSLQDSSKPETFSGTEENIPTVAILTGMTANLNMQSKTVPAAQAAQNLCHSAQAAGSPAQMLPRHLSRESLYHLTSYLNSLSQAGPSRATDTTESSADQVDRFTQQASPAEPALTQTSNYLKPANETPDTSRPADTYADSCQVNIEVMPAQDGLGPALDSRLQQDLTEDPVSLPPLSRCHNQLAPGEIPWGQASQVPMSNASELAENYLSDPALPAGGVKDLAPAQINQFMAGLSRTALSAQLKTTFNQLVPPLPAKKSKAEPASLTSAWFEQSLPQ